MFTTPGDFRQWPAAWLNGLAGFWALLNLLGHAPLVFGRFCWLDAILLAALALAALVFFKPAGLGGLLFFFGLSLFLFGFNSFSPVSWIFEFWLSLVLLVVTGRNLLEKEKSAVNRPLFLLLLFFVLQALFSLLLLPLAAIGRTALLWGPVYFLRLLGHASADTPFYALAAGNRLLLFALFAVALALHRQARQLWPRLFSGVFWGAFLAVAAGLAEYYGLVSWARYRPLDPIENPGNVLLRLQSLFGHPGWLAELAAIALPLILAGFMTRKTNPLRWARRAALVGLLLVFEIGLILAKARGGWITQALPLVFFWLFFYLYRPAEQGRSWRFNLKGILLALLSAVMTIGAALLLIVQVLGSESTSLMRSRRLQPAFSQVNERGRLAQRAAAVFRATDRSGLWRQGIAVGLESPLFGIGYETFRWHKSILDRIPDSRLRRDGGMVSSWDDPHNLYISLFAGTGLVGVILWSSLVLFALALLAADLVRNRRHDNWCIILLIICFHVYGLFQSMPYIPAIWLLIFLALGYALTVPEKTLVWPATTLRRAVFLALVVSVFASLAFYLFSFQSKHLARRYGLPVYGTDPQQQTYWGFYPPERWPEGVFRWSGPRAEIVLYTHRPVEITYRCATPGIDERPLTVDIRLDGRPLDRLRFTAPGRVTRSYGLPRGAKKKRLELRVSRTWCPETSGVSADVRDLGIAVSEVRILDRLPKD